MTPGLLLRPGTLPYTEAVGLQHRTAAGVRTGAPDTLILLQHPHTYTLGARGLTSSLLHAEDAYRARGADVIRSDRGGDVTYHGPGQLVGYPILDLNPHRRDVHKYVRDIEQALIDAVAPFGITADRAEGLTGIWVGRNKLAAIGVRISRWITSHGFALNVGTNLSHFDLIVPCGIQDRGVTSVERLLGRAVPMAEVEKAVEVAFSSMFSPRE